MLELLEELDHSEQARPWRGMRVQDARVQGKRCCHGTALLAAGPTPLHMPPPRRCATTAHTGGVFPPAAPSPQGLPAGSHVTLFNQCSWQPGELGQLALSGCVLPSGANRALLPRGAAADARLQSPFLPPAPRAAAGVRLERVTAHSISQSINYV
mgnify:CR=1 FL=1